MNIFVKILLWTAVVVLVPLAFVEIAALLRVGNWINGTPHMLDW